MSALPSWTYRPDLPTFSPIVTETQGGKSVIVSGQKQIVAWALSTEKKRERKALKVDRGVVSTTRAHRASYRPDLPLGSTDARGAYGTAWRGPITAEDRAYYAAHPITLKLQDASCRATAYSLPSSLNVTVVE